MKVCFFIGTLNNSGGTERATCAVAGKLIEYGYEVDIICWWGGNKKFFNLHERIKCYSIFERDRINIYSAYLKSLFKYRLLITKIKPDVIVDVCVPLSLITIPATIFKNVKTISWEQFNAKVTWGGISGKIARWMASRWASKIVVLTTTDKKEYQRRYGTDNQFVIPNPVAINSDEKSPLSSKNVLAVGRLTYQKGFDMLLQAWNNVVTQRNEAVKDWKLIIVGGGEDEIKLKHLCTRLGLDTSVVFVKPTHQIEAFYRDASIFVMSSRFEGLPLALVEAKAFGLPTISFDCETGPREVISDEVDGLLVKANDETGLAKAVLKVMMSVEIRNKFSANSIEKAKNYSLTAYCKYVGPIVKEHLMNYLMR